jgi:hypothetical protein
MRVDEISAENEAHDLLASFDFPSLFFLFRLWLLEDASWTSIVLCPCDNP